MSGRIRDEVIDYLNRTENQSERVFINRFLGDFDVTWVRKERNFNTNASTFLLKPLDDMSEAYGLDREVLCVYAPFPEFQPRTIQLAEYLLANFISVKERAEPLIYIVISDDRNIEEIISRHLIDNRQARLIIPFYKGEFEESWEDNYFIRNRFRKYLYSRDLFDMQSPLDNEVYYFGRKDLTPELIDRFRRGQNTGIFGLRKTGKTSLLHAVERAVEKDKIGHAIYVDAENPSIYQTRWFGSLFNILRIISRKLDVHLNYSIGDFNVETAGELFKDGISRILDDLPDQEKRLLLVIDEIEFISFNTSHIRHWNEDFLPFWQTMRATHHILEGKFAVLIAGVNALPLETASVNHIDNPLYLWVSPRYIPSFSVEEVRTMVRTLSRPMGMVFEDEVYEYLKNVYGGHPYLIRQACSWHHQRLKDQDRPIHINTDLLSRFQQQRDIDLEPFVGQIVQLLDPWYANEYEMLRLLASGDTDSFLDFAQADANSVRYIYKYELVEDRAGIPQFTISAVKRYFEKAPQAGIHNRHGQETAEAPNAITELERFWAEMSYLRNRLERRLRILIRNFLQARYAKAWIDKVINSISDSTGKRKDDLRRLNPEDVLDQTYILDLVSILDKNWEAFQALEQYKLTKKKVTMFLEYVNDHRPDAHAKPVEGHDLITLRMICEVFDNVFREYRIE